MLNVYIGDNVFSMPMARWASFRKYLYDNVDPYYYKYLFNMGCGVIYSSTIAKDTIAQIDDFMTEYHAHDDILIYLRQIFVNAIHSNKEVGFCVI